jgi:hypothetical protein
MSLIMCAVYTEGNITVVMLALFCVEDLVMKVKEGFDQ